MSQFLFIEKYRGGFWPDTGTTHPPKRLKTSAVAENRPKNAEAAGCYHTDRFIFISVNTEITEYSAP
ncbi:hypothetical protein [Silvimonas iriomotensis]|uniref:hypothetical protein n=1 Tax=Silvimonas iriomotensis TaxID=449662 RepID=UPI00166559A9|nr:hypothetical protein [Silvimonas iriomotensis]